MSSTTKFITPYGPKKARCNDFSPDMDTTDQRAPYTTPQQAVDVFLGPDPELMEELEREIIDDFDGDITEYEYEDRGEYGEDVVMSQRADIASAARRLANRKKSSRTS